MNVYDNDAYVYNKINEDLREGGLDVRAEDIIDIIGGYYGLGYGMSSQEDLGGFEHKQIVCIILLAESV